MISTHDRRPTKATTYLVITYKYRNAEARKKYGYNRIWQLMYLNPKAKYFLGETKLNPVQQWQKLPELKL